MPTILDAGAAQSQSKDHLCEPVGTPSVDHSGKAMAVDSAAKDGRSCAQLIRAFLEVGGCAHLLVVLDFFLGVDCLLHPCTWLPRVIQG